MVALGFVWWTSYYARFLRSFFRIWQLLFGRLQCAKDPPRLRKTCYGIFLSGNGRSELSRGTRTLNPKPRDNAL